MSGYRESSFDPNAGGEYGPPLRPFNLWQRIGVGLIIVGIAGVLAAFASQLRWLPAEYGRWLTSGTSLCLVGTVLVNSRRQKISPEQAAGVRRRTLIAVAVALAVFAVVLVAFLYFEGVH